jgi:hypothetical protein
MEFIIETLTLIKYDNPPANQQGLPQYYREHLLILCDVIEKLTKMKNNIESTLEEFES